MGARGEQIIQADGREVRVLFTNRAIADAEARIGKSIIGILEGYDVGTTGIRETASLLRSGMEAARREDGQRGRVSIDEAYDLLDAAGFAAVVEAVVLAIGDVLSYGPEGSDRPNV